VTTRTPAGERIEVTVLERDGIQVPDDINIVREELLDPDTA